MASSATRPSMSWCPVLKHQTNVSHCYQHYYAVTSLPLVPKPELKTAPLSRVLGNVLRSKVFATSLEKQPMLSCLQRAISSETELAPVRRT